MTVQQLIDELQQVKDKTKPAVTRHYAGADNAHQDVIGVQEITCDCYGLSCEVVEIMD